MLFFLFCVVAKCSRCSRLTSIFVCLSTLNKEIIIIIIGKEETSFFSGKLHIVMWSEFFFRQLPFHRTWNFLKSTKIFNENYSERRDTYFWWVQIYGEISTLWLLINICNMPKGLLTYIDIKEHVGIWLEKEIRSNWFLKVYHTPVNRFLLTGSLIRDDTRLVFFWFLTLLFYWYEVKCFFTF